MTDNEIIKALECCNGDLDCCKECPAKENKVECGDVLKNNALKLINRQKAEIERLTLEKENLRCVIDDLSNNTEYAKSEAIREFAERLKKKTYPFPCAIGVENAVTIRGISDLVEEMEGKMAECRKCKFYEHRSKTRTGFCRNKKSNWYGLIVRGGKKAPDYCFRRVKQEAASVSYIEQRVKQISDDELIELVYDIIESYEAMRLLCLDCSREEISALIAEAVLAANAGKS